MMIVEQIKADLGDNFAYLVGCSQTHQAVVIDPQKNTDAILKRANALELHIVHIINTHRHSDHTVGNRELQNQTHAKIIMHAADASRYPAVDIKWHQETVLQLGQIELQVIHTPGHTPGGICLYAKKNLFTGDTLFVGDSGRTDLAGGDRKALGASIRKLMQFPEDTIVWPGHDYGPMPSSTLKWEKCHNINAKEYGYYACD